MPAPGWAAALRWLPALAASLCCLGAARGAPNGTDALAEAGAAAKEEKPIHAFDILERSEGELFMLMATGTFMLAFVAGNFLHLKRVTFIPESLVVIGLGVLLFFFNNLVPWTDPVTLAVDSVLNRKLLRMFLLPIIIFEAGWSLRNQEFFSQLPYILLFAIFGTVICMCVVAGLIVASGAVHGIRSVRVAFAYGALISAVDPVATLATYAHLNVDPLLNILVMGESIVNDAVAIVLFQVLNDPPLGHFSSQSLSVTMLDISIGVMKLLCGSILLGLFLGCVYIFLLRVGRMSHSPALEILFVYQSCFFSYAFAENVCGMSGIITVLFCGMIMSAYAEPLLSIEGRLLCSFLLKQMASLADMAVFLFVGLAIPYCSQSFAFGGFLVLFCLFGRATAVLPLGILSNAVKQCVDRRLPREKRNLLSWKHIFMMWHAGLRGGIALVLTLELGGWVDELNGAGTRETLRNATILVICLFLLVFGGTTEMLLRVLGIPIGDPPPMYISGDRWMQLFHDIREQALRPILIGDKTADTHMHGGVVKQVLAEATISDHVERTRTHNLVSESGLRVRHELFGMQDPLFTDVVDAPEEDEDEEEEDSEESD